MSLFRVTIGDPALENRPENSSGLQIVVRNLPWNVTSEMLRGTFEQIGEVTDAEVVYHADWAAPRAGALSSSPAPRSPTTRLLASGALSWPAALWSSAWTASTKKIN